MKRRWGAFLLTLLLALGSSCGRTPLPTRPTTEIADLDPAQELSASHRRGAREVIGRTRSGALYALYRPERWKGDLVLYAHGYTAPTEPIHLPPIDDLRDLLLGQGFAVAYSSFSENGLAVRDGIRQTERLEALFGDRLGRPRRVFLVGSSLGGLIAVALAERHPDRYAGLLTVSGLIGGSRALIDYIAHVRVLFEVFYPGVLQGDLLNIPPGLNVNQHVVGPAVAAIRADPQGAAIISQLAQTPVPFASGEQLVASIVQALVLHFIELEDLLRRTGGDSFFDNSRVEYSGPLPAPVLADINARVARHRSTPEVREFMERYYEPNGRLRIPMLTIHNELDPVVPSFNEARYRERVARRGNARLLVQRSVDGRYGHSEQFTAQEISQAFGELVRRAGRPDRDNDDDRYPDAPVAARGGGIGAGLAGTERPVGPGSLSPSQP
jgi:pimeloyl-ACP methyl ester carboxylesterase